MTKEVSAWREHHALVSVFSDEEPLTVGRLVDALLKVRRDLQIKNATLQEYRGIAGLTLHCALSEEAP